MTDRQRESTAQGSSSRQRSSLLRKWLRVPPVGLASALVLLGAAFLSVLDDFKPTAAHILAGKEVLSSEMYDAVKTVSVLAIIGGVLILLQFVWLWLRER